MAQSSNSTPSNSTDAQQSPEKSDETLKVNVNVVGVFFNVKDKHGMLIPNQTKDDFQVFEDGKPQTIKYFAAESNLPLTLGILIDSSGSQVRVLDMEKEVGGAFLRQILTDKDEAFVIDFDVESELVQDYTRDVHRLQDALNKVKINSGFASGGAEFRGLGRARFRSITPPEQCFMMRFIFRQRHACQGSRTESNDPANRWRG